MRLAINTFLIALSLAIGVYAGGGYFYDSFTRADTSCPTIGNGWTYAGNAGQGRIVNNMFYSLTERSYDYAYRAIPFSKYNYPTEITYQFRYSTGGGSSSNFSGIVYGNTTTEITDRAVLDVTPVIYAGVNLVSGVVHLTIQNGANKADTTTFTFNGDTWYKIKVRLTAKAADLYYAASADAFSATPTLSLTTTETWGMRGDYVSMGVSNQDGAPQLQSAYLEFSMFSPKSGAVSIF